MPNGGLRGEVFDTQFIGGKVKVLRKTETEFIESPVLLIGKLEVDPLKDNNEKIAAFDMDYTLIKTISETKLANGCFNWEVLFS